MKAITVQQPWAWAVIHGGKDIENRTRIGTWRPALGERVAIHAGLRLSDRGAADDRVYDAALELVSKGVSDSLPRGRQAHGIVFARWIDLVYGAILGTAEVVNVHPDAGCCPPWGESSYVEQGGSRRIDVVHLVLEQPRSVEPIPCRGALGLWTVPDDIAARLA